MSIASSEQKLGYLQGRQLTPADELRELLTSLENAKPRITELTSPEALILLHDLDHATELMARLELKGVELTSEQGQFEALQGGLRRRSKAILQSLGGPRKLTQQRPEPRPELTRWWWYVDEIVARQRRRFRQRLGFVSGVIVLILVSVIVIFNTVLAPDPLVLARYDLERNVIIALEMGEIDEALIEFEGLSAEVTDDVGVLLLHGLVLELAEQPTVADEKYRVAQQSASSSTLYHLGRAQLYLRVGWLEKAETQTRVVLDEDDQFARGWLLLGDSLARQGRIPEATEAYQLASQLAFEQGEDQVIVMARLALGQLQFNPQ